MLQCDSEGDEADDDKVRKRVITILGTWYLNDEIINWLVRCATNFNRFIESVNAARDGKVFP